MESVHGVAVTRFRLHSFGFQFKPLQVVHFLEVYLPDIVQVETR